MWRIHSYARRASSWRPPTSSAIAASTRFHGSVLPPGTHGMLPSACCTEAIASTVARTCARLMTPGTSGRSSRRTGAPSFRRLGDLLDVDDEALAEHGVEPPFERREPTGVVLDRPAQEVVVLAHRRGVVADAVRGLQPPVGRVERVRVVRAAQERPGPFELLFELVLPVDADVAAGRVVVLVVERPVDAFGPARRHRDRKPAAGPQHAHEFLDRALVVPD